MSVCQYPGCTNPAVPKNFTVKTAFFVVRVMVARNPRFLCQQHLLQALFQKELPGLGRAPGAGVPYKRKAFCDHRKESVSFEECAKCFKSRQHKKGFNHIGCQDAFLQPSPLAPLDKELIKEAG